MARRKSSKKNIRKIMKVGKRSYAVTLPIEVMREANKFSNWKS